MASGIDDSISGRTLRPMTMNGTLLLIIPCVVQYVGKEVAIDEHFANNLNSYTENFDHVTFACSVAEEGELTSHKNLTRFSDLKEPNKVSFIALPEPYREDRFYLNYWSMYKIFKSEIKKADYLLFSPHAMYDWPLMATRLAISMGRSFDMEADWHIESIEKVRLADMKPSLKKIRKVWWSKRFTSAYLSCLGRSSVALLQGGDVYEAYKNIAPNPQKVLNIQVTAENRISNAALETKLERIRSNQPLDIVYAGRAIDMKGPFDWLKAIEALVKDGVKLRATWFGDGKLLDEMKQFVAKAKIEKNVVFAGNQSRDTMLDAVKQADIFMFCHKTSESPRNIVESLASSCPIIGYESRHARDLVEKQGGGEFCQINDWQALAKLVKELDSNRSKLEDLTRSAHATAKLLDRDLAMQHRIDLIKKYVKPPRELLQMQTA